MEYVDLEIEPGWVFATRPFLYDHSDPQVLEEHWGDVDVYGIRDKQNIRTVLDIGANMGAFTFLVCKLYPDAQIVSFEPEPENYEVLLENIRRLDHHHQITPVMKAVWGHEGTVSMSAGSGGGWEHLGMVVHVCDDDTFCYNTQCRHISLTSDCITLDQAAAGLSEIDFLKMDAEGAEFVAFEHATCLDRIRYIGMEFHDLKGDEAKAKLWKKLNETHDMVESQPHIWWGERRAQ